MTPERIAELRSLEPSGWPPMGLPGADAVWDEMLDEIERLHGLLSVPEVEEFLDGTRREVAHQVERWGTVHDRAKEPADWFWLIGFLAGKALQAAAVGDRDKALHHTISSAAALANWHAHIKLGGGAMTPGSSDIQQFVEQTFGSEVSP